MHSSAVVSCGAARPCCGMRSWGHAQQVECNSRVGLSAGGRTGLPELVRIGVERPTRVGGPAVVSLRVGAAGVRAFASTSEKGSASQNGNAGEVRGRSDGARSGGGGGGGGGEHQQQQGQGGQSLVHALHEAATVFQFAMEEQEALTRGPWFAQKWLGIDKNAWMRGLTYQA